MDEWNNKAWGSYRKVYSGDDSIIVQNRISKGGYCSVHYHERHSNTFLVEQGSICVAIYNPAGWAKQVYQVQAGRGFTVTYGEYHQFFAKEDSLVSEWYVLFKRNPDDLQYASLNDIVRKEGMSAGGIRVNYPYENVPHVWA